GALPGADGAALDRVGRTPVLGGGEPVGEVRATFGPGRAA
ncbi:asparaginase, partial [Actinotalea fermentans ATCC 43279 = JCM 9966 = DSM 3133]